MTREDLFTPKSIRTYSGKYLNVFDINLDTIVLEDIAHALSNQCRWGGHISKFYSVAEHSIHCQRLVDKPFMLSALMHDASEAYLLDIPRPIKNELTQYKEIEHSLMLAIADKFDFEYPMSEPVKEADDKMLKIEWNELILKVDKSKEVEIMHFNPEEAKHLFLTIFQFLKGQQDAEFARKHKPYSSL
jgi:5'-deoxynucleotidase YfbR-like HD superfamily hydrolase